MIIYTRMITSLISGTSKKEQSHKKGEVMGKLLVMEEREEFHRVWNFVVPLHKLGSNSHILAIPPLTKNYSRKHRRAKKRST